ncbi:MAG: hypothetical protein AUJ72_03720 [Candidatus Omnitrophica bacterium CG1_02_46_14]|nr:MAG: hypothetical protein AUJ72_03720 [Candidatus Omnitrophica bacterium CG1_02_46_14]
MHLTLFILIVLSISTLFILIKKWSIKKRSSKNLPDLEEPQHGQAIPLTRNRLSDLLDKAKASLQLTLKNRPGEPLVLRYLGSSNVLEAMIYIKITNTGSQPLVLQKIIWDIWIEGLHIVSGTYADKIKISAGSPEHEVYLHNSLLDSQTVDALWAVKKDETLGYFEGTVTCETEHGRFQKKFNFLNLRFAVSGSATKPPKDISDESNLDGLTGLFQRKYLESNLQSMIDRNIHRSPISFVMLDIDNFKKINDECGHLTGDEVLKTVGRIIKDAVQNRGASIRYGGDEIAIVLINCGAEEARGLMEAVRAQIEKFEFEVPEGVLRVTASIGLATITSQTSFKALIRAADNVLSLSKQNGKNRISVNSRKIEPID